MEETIRIAAIKKNGRREETLAAIVAFSALLGMSIQPTSLIFYIENTSKLLGIGKQELVATSVFCLLYWFCFDQ